MRYREIDTQLHSCTNDRFPIHSLSEWIKMFRDLHAKCCPVSSGGRAVYYR